MRKSIYIFSGLGADERVFRQLDLSNYRVTFIKWITPYTNEAIESYAVRITKQINESNPILIGLSFGGIIALEIAKQINFEKIILIASVKTKKEIPPYYRFMGKMNFHKFVPSKLLKKVSNITSWLFGANTASEKELLKQIIDDTDTVFLKWAIDKIVKWENITLVKNTKHIHGNNDRVLPFRFVDSDFTIQQGGHLIPLTHSTELMNILNKEI